MCSNPQMLRDGTEIGCRDCKQCRGRKVLDWTGRCIAESRTAVAASVVTLTYGGGDHVRAAILTYSDVQKWFKLLRKRGYPIKYLAVGEYGSEKGRAHWHIIIYWKQVVYPHVDMNGNFVGKIPLGLPVLTGEWDGVSRCYKPPMGKKPARFYDDSWPHGHMVWDVPDVAALRYATKYLLKDTSDAEKQYHLSMSKVPPLGHDYFANWAKQHVEQGLSPQTLVYRFDEARDGDGKPLRFCMTGVTAKNFLQCFVETWRELRPNEVPPFSEVVEKYLDSLILGTVEDWDREILFEKRLKESQQGLDPAQAARRTYRDSHNAYFFGANLRRLYTGEIFTDEQAKQETGKTKPGYSAPLGTWGAEAVADWNYGSDPQDDSFPGDK